MSNESKTPTPTKEMSQEEIIQFAKDLIANKYWMTDQMRPNEQESMLMMIFLPLAMMSPEQHKEFVKEKPAILFGKLKDAMPRSINGYPIFHTMGYLTTPQYVAVRKAEDALRKAMEDAENRVKIALSQVGPFEEKKP